MRRLREILHDKRGGEMVEFIISLALKLGILVVCLLSFVYVFNGMRLYVACDKAVRSVSVSGLVDSTTYSLIDTMSGSMTVTTNISGTFLDAGHTKIQLRDTFTITLTSSYDIPIITPLSGGPPVVISLPIRVQITGMSEKFWREE